MNAEIHARDPNALLYDSGRFPIWFRLPALAFGIGTLGLAISLAAHNLLGTAFLLGEVRGSPVLGSLGLLAIGAPWIFAWFAHFRILFDDEHQELIVRARGYFGWHDRRVAVAAARGFRIERVRSGRASWKWKVTVETAGGPDKWLADITRDIKPLARSLAMVTKLPVTVTPDPAAMT